METPRSNLNSVNNYPNKEVMELFLDIWNKINLFNTVKGANWNTIYTNVNAIVTLAIICDYLCLPGKEQEKQSFLEEVKQNDTSIYKKMWELALKIWEWKWNLSTLSQSMINSNRKRIKEVSSNIYCFPVISDKENFPNRITNIHLDTIIDQNFKTELSRLNWITQSANEIQAQYQEHNFNRWVNSEEIKNLKNQL